MAQSSISKTSIRASLCLDPFYAQRSAPRDGSSSNHPHAFSQWAGRKEKINLALRIH
jgi:hypothetical protein